MELSIRPAAMTDLELFFRWKNDPVALQNSFDSRPVSLEDHTRWFSGKLEQPQALLLVFENERHEAVGHVRFETEGDTAIIGITVDPAFRGQQLSSRMLEMACTHYFSQHPDKRILAFVKIDNLASCKAFTAAGFSESARETVAGIERITLIRHHVGFPG